MTAELSQSLTLATPELILAAGAMVLMLTGVNIEATVALAQALTIPVIASGGITNLDDVKRLCAVEQEGVIGAITGRAIYEGTLDFSAAQKLADELNP